MKHIVIIALCALVGIPQAVDAHNYGEGDLLSVVAQAGLRLRMAPSQHAKTIQIMQFGDPVIVVNTHGFDDQHADRIGWMDGHWIKVRYEHLEGYVFDAFLSGLAIPDHESQLCVDCEHLMYPLDQYLFMHHPTDTIYEGPDHSEHITQFVSKLNGDILVTKTSGDGWYQVEVEFYHNRLCEVLNLMRSTLVGRPAQQGFEESLKFYENAFGEISKVVLANDRPITIEKTSNGSVLISSTILSTVDGC